MLIGADNIHISLSEMNRYTTNYHTLNYYVKCTTLRDSISSAYKFFDRC